MKTTQEQQAVLDAFYAPVKKVVTAELFPAATLPYNEAAIIVTTPTQGDVVVNFCSNGYGLVPCADIFPPLEAELAKNFDYSDAQYRVVQHAKFYANYTLQGNEVTANRTKLIPVLHIQHSYNSKIVFGINLGYFNPKTESVLWGAFNGRQISHSMGNIEAMIESSIELANYFIEQKEEVTEMFKKLGKKDNRSETELRVLEVIEKTGFHKVHEIIVEMLAGKTTDWDIYCAMNTYLFSPSVQMQEEQKIKVDRLVFSYLSLN